MAKKYSTRETNNTAADLGFETTLCIAEEDKHVRLGVICLRYISDAINEIQTSLIRSMENSKGQRNRD